MCVLLTVDSSIPPHENLIEILGYSLEMRTLIMSYERNGSLFDCIHAQRTVCSSSRCAVADFRQEKQWTRGMFNQGVSLEIKALRKSIALEIANGMQHIHHFNVVHCDLTSKNILVLARVEFRALISQLNDKFRVKITDFGLSVTKDQARGELGFGTTPWYACM
jgi:serine/threonine protein kinase